MIWCPDATRVQRRSERCCESCQRWRSIAGQPRRNPDLRIQRAMHWTLVRNLQKFLALCAIEITLDCDLAFDAIDLFPFGIAVGAVLGVDLRVRGVPRQAGP